MAVKGYIPGNPGVGQPDTFWMKSWFKQIKDFCAQTVDVAVVQTADFTCREFQFYPCDTDGGALTVTLPPASGLVGRRYTVKNYTGTNIITVTPDGLLADTIEGAPTHVIPAQVISVTYVCDGVNNWYVDCCDEGAGGAGIAGITVEDEGVGVGTAAGITSIDFVGGGVTATAVGAAATVTIPTPPAVEITTQDEGIDLSTTVNKLNFVGDGVTASGAGDTTTVTIPGGIAGITVKDEGSDVGTTAGITSIDFVGGEVTASGAGAAATVTIPAVFPGNGNYGLVLATHMGYVRR